MKLHVFCTYKTFLFLFYSFMLIVMTTCQKNWKVWTLFLKWKLKSWKIFEQKIWNLNERYYCYLLLFIICCYVIFVLSWNIYSHILVYGIMLSIVHKVYFCSLLTFYPKNKEKIGKKRSVLKLTFFLSFQLEAHQELEKKNDALAQKNQAMTEMLKLKSHKERLVKECLKVMW